jgi:hypothetical protein
MLLDAPATGLEPLLGPLAPFPVERDLVGETDFILEAAFVVAFLGAFEAGTAFFGGISTFTYQILARKFEYIVPSILFLPGDHIRYFWHNRLFALFKRNFYDS